MRTLVNVILVATGITSALMAGLFYAYSCSVTLGLARLSDHAYLSAMQSINRAILNPVFFLGFMGALILLPLSTFLHYQQQPSARFWLLLGATIVYAVGVFGVTAAGNVPMNNMLDAFNISGVSAEQLAAQRLQFEEKWNSLNMIRTVASVLTVTLVIIACLCPQKVPAK